MRIHETDLKYNEKQSLLATAKIIDLATVLEVALLGYIKNRTITMWLQEQTKRLAVCAQIFATSLW